MSQRLHLKVSSHWELQLQHLNFGGDPKFSHSAREGLGLRAGKFQSKQTKVHCCLESLKGNGAQGSMYRRSQANSRYINRAEMSVRKWPHGSLLVISAPWICRLNPMLLSRNWSRGGSWASHPCQD